MPTERKAEIISVLKEKIGRAQGIFLTSFQGLSVQEINDLRRKCRKVSADYRVAKNTLTIRAVEGSEAQVLQPYLTGPIALALAYQDSIATAKVLSDFAQENKAFQIRMGLFDGKVVNPVEIRRIAQLPPREVLLSQLLAGFQAPLTGLVGTLSGLLRNLVSVVEAITRQVESEHGPPEDTTSS